MGEFSPIAGDPSAVADGAARMQSAADAMRQAAATLRQLADTSDFRSEAIDAVRSNAGQLADVITKAEVRYRGAGDALAEFAPKLANAQDAANEAIAAYHATDVGSAEHTARTYWLAAHDPLSSHDERAHWQRMYADAEADLHAQQHAVGVAQNKYDSAVQDLTTAAKYASDQIKDADDVSGLNDSFWDNLDGLVEKYVKPFLAALDDALEEVGQIVGALATLALVVSIFFPPAAVLAGILGTASLVLAVADLGVKLDRFALGDLTLGDLIVGAIGVAISVLITKVAIGGKLLTALKSRQTTFERDGIQIVQRRGFDGRFFKLSERDDRVGDLIDDTLDHGKDELLTRLPPILNYRLSPTPLWFVQQREHHDVGPISADFSGVEADQIVERSLATAEYGPLVCTPVTTGGGQR